MSEFITDDLRVRFEEAKGTVDGKPYYIVKYGLSDAETLLAVLVAALHVRAKRDATVARKDLR